MPWTADRRIYVNAQDQVVEEGAPDAAFLLVGAGGTLPLAEARRRGLVAEEASAQEPQGEEKAQPSSANKSRQPGANKQAAEVPAPEPAPDTAPEPAPAAEE